MKTCRIASVRFVWESVMFVIIWENKSSQWGQVCFKDRSNIFPNLTRHTNVKTEGDEWTRDRINSEKSTPRCIVTRLLKIKDKKYILKAAREKWCIIIREQLNNSEFIIWTNGCKKEVAKYFSWVEREEMLTEGILEYHKRRRNNKKCSNVDTYNVPNQDLVNLKNLKSYQAFLLTTMLWD